MWSQLAAVLLLVAVTPLTEAAVRSGGEWRGKVQSLEQHFEDKTTPQPPAQWLLPPRRSQPQYVEAAVFRKTVVELEEAPESTTTTTTSSPPDVDPSTESVNTPAPETEREELVLPARFPPVWRPTLLGEDLVGSLLRHTATDEFERSHGQYVDSFIHGQPLGYF